MSFKSVSYESAFSALILLIVSVGAASTLPGTHGSLTPDRDDEHCNHDKLEIFFDTNMVNDFETASVCFCKINVIHSMHYI